MDRTTEIAAALPHRYPFLMVDRVVEVVPGRRAVAVKNITADSGAGNGGRAEYPQVFLLEAMAQVGALAAAGPGLGSAGGMGIPGYLAGINDARFGVRPLAGDVVVFTLDFVAASGGLVRFNGVATVGEEIAAEAGLTFSVPRMP